MKIIDATNLILGRMASHIAKQLLLGEEIEIVNCESAVISGKPKMTIKKFHEKEARGDAIKGPFPSWMPDRIVKRTIRGMLPFRRSSEGSRGRQALGKLKCYIGVPEEFAGKKFETIKEASADKLKIPFMTIGEISRIMRQK